MTKVEIKKAKPNSLIVDLVRSYAWLIEAYNHGGAIKRIEQHCDDLMAELLKRGLLTESDVKYLNS